MDNRPPPTSRPAVDGIQPLGLEPPLPPADRAERAEQDAADRHPREAGVQEQEDVGTETNVEASGAAVVVEQCMAFRRGETDTDHGRSPGGVGAGGPRAAARDDIGKRCAHPPPLRNYYIRGRPPRRTSFDGPDSARLDPAAHRSGLG